MAYSGGNEATDSVGTYADAIGLSAATGGTFTASNYTITYVDGDLTVDAASLTITATAQSKTYGTALSGGAGYTAFTSVGLQNSETVGSVTVAYSGGNEATDSVGTYADAIGLSAATGGTFTASNYTITYVDGELTVNRADLTVTADNVTKTYGDTLSNTDSYTKFTTTGLKNSETVGNVNVVFGTGASATAPAGIYLGSIVISNAKEGTFSTDNYTIVYVAGNIRVTGEPPVPNPPSPRPDVNNGGMINDATQYQTDTSWRNAIDNGASNSIDSDLGFEPNEVEGIGLMLDSLITFSISENSVGNGVYSMGGGNAEESPILEDLV